MMKKISFLMLLLSVLTAGAAELFTHDVKTEKKPWTHTNFQNRADEFSFIIIPDRTGGERKKGIWAEALKKANMFHPDFIITVGDLIEGINKPHLLTKERMEAQVSELRKITEKSSAPFFYLAGNHDISRTRKGFPKVNEMGADIWKKNFGVTYYSFVYKNVLFLCLDQQEGRDSRQKQCGLTPEQTEWALNTLKKHSGVRWTIIFVHSPWTWCEEPFSRIEKAMADRDYTVFSGDFHFYTRYRFYNRDYYQLATAGGASAMRGTNYGEFDHITYVTMTEKGPEVVNILLNGILNENILPAENSNHPKVKRVLEVHKEKTR